MTRKGWEGCSVKATVHFTQTKQETARYLYVLFKMHYYNFICSCRAIVQRMGSKSVCCRHVLPLMPVLEVETSCIFYQTDLFTCTFSTDFIIINIRVIIMSPQTLYASAKSQPLFVLVARYGCLKKSIPA